MSRIATTHRHTRATQYRLRGGAWDGPTLDGLLRDVPAPRIGAPHDALVDGDIRLTATDVDDLASCLAGGLRDQGVKRRDAVAWQLTNGYEAVILYRACWRLGAVAVPIHHQAGEGELDQILAAVDPKVVVGASHLPLGHHPEAVVVGGPSLPTRRGAREETPTTAHAAKSGAPFAKLLAAEPETSSRAQSSDVAVVLFTAGSTGTPKGVIHTHRTLVTKARSMPERHGLGPSDVVLMPAPLAHVSGLLNGLLVPSVAGMTSVLMTKWNPSLALDLIERERVSFMVGPPTYFLGLMHDPDFSSRRVRSLRVISTGGAGVSPAFVDAATEALGARIKRAYGSTEAPTVTASSPTDDPELGRSTDGRAIGDTEVRVVDRDTGADRDLGDEGEVWVRGPELFAGYLDQAQTDEAFARGGWFRTGDLGVLDDEGWLTITGRCRDVIIRGGENITAAEVEAVLDANPAVRQSVAVGYPDDRLGERVGVAVVLTAGTNGFDLAECRSWFRQQGVATFKTPEQVIVLDELPVLASGKPDRAAVRALFAI